jgi:hypothetical protein
VKVLLVERGEPFSLYGAPDEPEGDSQASWPLLVIDKATCIPSPASEWRDRWDLCVLPAALFLESGISTIPVPAIVYGAVDMAFSCFEAGASDFMREGWTWLELEARLYRLWQPSANCGNGRLVLRGITAVWEAFGRRGKTEGGPPAPSSVLSPAEAEILRRFLATPGRIVPTASLMLCGHRSDNGGKALAMRISRLKTKLSRLEPGLGKRIEAVRGLGYLWVDG